MLKKLILMSSIITTPILAHTTAQEAWRNYQTLKAQKKAENVFYQLEQSAQDVGLNDAEKKLLHDCLAKDCSSCTSLLYRMHDKRKQDARTLEEAAQNGKKLDTILQDEELSKAEKKEFIKALQLASDSFLETLDALMPSNYRLYRYPCALILPDYLNHEYTELQYHYLLRITNKNGDRIIVLDMSNDNPEGRPLSELEMRVLDNLKKCNFENRYLGQISRELFDSECPLSEKCALCATRKEATSRQVLTHMIWNGKAGSTKIASQEFLKVICARSGSLVELLQLAYDKQMRDFVCKLNTVITKLSCYRPHE